jgi:SRSO17 transposase
VHVVIRYRDRDVNKVVKTDYYLSNAATEVSLLEFARAAKAEHRIEECIQRGKSEVGMGDYEVRNWRGWHHHQTLSLLANWFLITETKRGKKNNPGDYRSTDSRRCGIDPPSSLWMRYQLSDQARTRAAIKTK